VKFYCINTGQVLKQRLFIPMPMPNRVIKRVNAIGEQKGQGCTFQFLTRHCEPYKWTNEVLGDNPEFQGLLNNSKETAVYPNVSFELPGVELEVDEHKYQTVKDEPNPDFWELAGAALHNVGIDADEVVCGAQAQMTEEEHQHGPTLVEAAADKIEYKLTFNLPDAGLPPANTNLKIPLGDDRDNAAVVAMTHNHDDGGQSYPLQARRSVVATNPMTHMHHVRPFYSLGWCKCTGVCSR
jgi:hypothetical protein